MTGNDKPQAGEKHGGSPLQIPIFYKLMAGMMLVATLPMILLGIVSIGGTTSIVANIGLGSSILVITLITVSVVVMWSFYLASSITHPIVRIAAIAKDMSEGKGGIGNTGTGPISNDEIGELQMAFARLVERYQAREAGDDRE